MLKLIFKRAVLDRIRMLVFMFLVSCGLQLSTWGNTAVPKVSEIQTRNSIYHVSTIADLRNLDSDTDRQAVRLKGYYAAGDGGGGVFNADFSDTTSKDNGGTIIVSTGGTRWKRIDADNVLDVAAFGIFPGLDDQTLKLKMAVASQPHHLAIRFSKKGDYLFRRDGNSPNSILIEGRKSVSIEIVQGVSINAQADISKIPYDFIRCVGCGSVKVFGKGSIEVELTGNPKKRRNAKIFHIEGLVGNETNRIVIRDLSLRIWHPNGNSGFGRTATRTLYGILIQTDFSNNESPRARNVRITGLKFLNSEGRTIQLNAIENALIDNNIITGLGKLGSGVGIRMIGVNRNIEVLSNTIILGDSPAASSAGVVCGQLAGSGVPSKIHIRKNTIISGAPTNVSSFPRGIDLSEVDGAVIANNNIIQTAGHAGKGAGIRFRTTSGSGFKKRARNITISNNVISGWNKSQIFLKDETAGMANIVVDGNIFGSPSSKSLSTTDRRIHDPHGELTVKSNYRLGSAAPELFQ